MKKAKYGYKHCGLMAPVREETAHASDACFFQKSFVIYALSSSRDLEFNQLRNEGFGGFHNSARTTILIKRTLIYLQRTSI